MAETTTDSAPFVFDKAGAKRVVAATKSYETSRDYGNDPSGRPNPAPQCITVKLTSRHTTDTSKYGWQQERRTTAGWETVTGGLTGTTTANFALSPDESGIDDLTGQHVILARTGIRQADTTFAPGWMIVGVLPFPRGQYQYMTLQMVTQNKSGWDWPRLHNLI